MRIGLHGIIPIVATPFDSSGAVDYESLDRLIDHLLEQGAHGLGVFGNAGEGYALVAEERREILARVVARANGHVPICAGIGETGTTRAIEVCRESAELGANALMVLPPFYLKPDAEGVVDFYRAIADAVTLAIMVQDAPLLTGVPLPPALLARLSTEVPTIEYAKIEAPPTAPKVSQVREAAPELKLLGGLNGQFLIEEFGRGACGTMPAADMTSIYAGILEHLEADRRDEAWKSFARALPLMRFELQPGLGVSAVKHNLVERGVIRHPTVRSPTRTLDADGLRELAELRQLVFG